MRRRADGSDEYGYDYGDKPPRNKSMDAIDGLEALSKGDGGWAAIPNGKKGGQRKRVGNKYQYRYPDGKGGWKSSPGGKSKSKGKAKKKTEEGTPEYAGYKSREKRVEAARVLYSDAQEFIHDALRDPDKAGPKFNAAINLLERAKAVHPEGTSFYDSELAIAEQRRYQWQGKQGIEQQLPRETPSLADTQKVKRHEREVNRKELELQAWKQEHPDFRSTIDGVKHIMVADASTGATVLTPVGQLTDFELAKVISGSATKAAGAIDPHNPSEAEARRIQDTEAKLYEHERDYDNSVQWPVKYEAYRALASAIEVAEKRFGPDHPVVPPGLRDKRDEMRRTFDKRSEEARVRLANQRERKALAGSVQLDDYKGVTITGPSKAMIDLAAQLDSKKGMTGKAYEQLTAMVDQYTSYLSHDADQHREAARQIREYAHEHRGTAAVRQAAMALAVAHEQKSTWKSKQAKQASTNEGVEKMMAEEKAKTLTTSEAAALTGAAAVKHHTEAVNDAMAPLHDPRNKTKDKAPRGHKVVGALNAIIAGEKNNNLRPVDRTKIKKELNRHLKAARKHYRNMSQAQYSNSPTIRAARSRVVTSTPRERLRDNLALRCRP